jgi:hypothetical protein
MGVPYYPYTEDAQPGGLVLVDGTYAFDWDAWGDDHWAELDRIYRELPGWIGYDLVPWWFGPSHDRPPALWASVEPPGLQVAGRVRADDWRAWHAAFFARIQHLPGRDEDAEPG